MSKQEKRRGKMEGRRKGERETKENIRRLPCLDLLGATVSCIHHRI